MSEKVVIIGAGSWGTALGLVLASKNYDVTLWEYNEKRAMEVQETRENTKYLPNITLPENIKVTSKVEGLLNGVKYVIFSVPSQVLREIIKLFAPQFTEETIIVNTAKGIEVLTGKSLSNVIKDEIIGKYHKNIVILSGPTHAEEVALSLPTAIVAAGEREKALEIQHLFNTKTFRVYLNEDMLGVEIGAAVKNCLAIAAGIADGMGFGDNTKAALITRGVAEMIRFGKKLGANEKTFSGLTGIGDLIVTCASKHSRNRYVGECLGKGEKIDEILSKMTMVAEGVPTVKAVYEKSLKLGIDMPIVEATYNVIYNNDNVYKALELLMEREMRAEFY